MRPSNRLHPLGLVPLLALAAAGCSLLPGHGATAPAPIHLRVSAAARLNPDEHGESLPTAVRIYQLKSAAKAGAAELAPLLRDQKELLGEDLLAVEEVFVEPRGSAEKTVAREKDARAVLVVGVFRRPSGEGWRDVVELPSGGRKTELEYVLDEYRLTRR